MQERFIPYHELLPTPEQAHHNPNIVFSDSLPFVFPVFLNNKNSHINVLTYDIGDPVYSGFDLAKRNDEKKNGIPCIKYNEIEKSHITMGKNAFDHRLERIANGLKTLINTEELDIIVLQKVRNPLRDKIMLALKTLKIEWEICLEDRRDIIYPMMIYRKDKFDRVNAPFDNEGFFSTQFVTQNNGSIIISNVQMKPRKIIHEVENLIKSQFEKNKNKEEGEEEIVTVNKYHLIIGLFAAYIEPTDQHRTNRVSRVVSCLYRQNSIQGIEWTTGAFFQSTNGCTTQLKGKIVNPSGEKFDPLTIPLGYLNPVQGEEIHLQRMHMCLSQKYKTNMTFPNKTNLFEFEQFIQTSLKDSTIVIRESTNACNDIKLGIFLGNNGANENIYTLLKNKIHSSSVEWYESHEGYFLFFPVAAPFSEVIYNIVNDLNRSEYQLLGINAWRAQRHSDEKIAQQLNEFMFGNKKMEVANIYYALFTTYNGKNEHNNEHNKVVKQEKFYVDVFTYSLLISTVNPECAHQVATTLGFIADPNQPGEKSCAERAAIHYRTKLTPVEIKIAEHISKTIDNDHNIFMKKKLPFFITDLQILWETSEKNIDIQLTIQLWLKNRPILNELSFTKKMQCTLFGDPERIIAEHYIQLLDEYQKNPENDDQKDSSSSSNSSNSSSNSDDRDNNSIAENLHTENKNAIKIKQFFINTIIYALLNSKVRDLVQQIEKYYWYSDPLNSYPLINKFTPKQTAIAKQLALEIDRAIGYRKNHSNNPAISILLVELNNEYENTFMPTQRTNSCQFNV